MQSSTRTFDGIAYPDAAASDPVALGYMQGSPPPADRIIRFGDDRFLRFPQLRWSLSHLRELIPTASVGRGRGPTSDLGTPSAAGMAELDGLRFTDLHGISRSWAEALAETYTDGIVVLRRGLCVYERYFGALRPELTHACFSITKSYVGLLAELLIHERVLDPDRTVVSYLPEMARSAFAHATLRQVLDMQVGVAFNEDYADPQADVWAYTRAAGLRTCPADYTGPRTLYPYLPTLRGAGAHGVEFAYATVCTEVLCWILRRASSLSLATLLSRRLWSLLGCEENADFAVDATGIEIGGAGLSCTLRDLARFGELMRCEGMWQGRELVPRAVIESITRRADASRFPMQDYPLLTGYAYRSMWWVANDALGVVEGRGIFGQRLYIAPAAGVVIARFASHPVGSSAANDPVTLPAFRALAMHLADATGASRDGLRS